MHLKNFQKSANNIKKNIIHIKKQNNNYINDLFKT